MPIPCTTPPSACTRACAHQGAADDLVVRVRLVAPQGHDVHDEARGAEVALFGALLGHAAREGGGLLAQRLKRGYLVTVGTPHGHRAGEDRAAVEPHGAQAAAARLAAALDALEAPRAQELEQRLVRGGVLLDLVTVDDQIDEHTVSRPSPAASVNARRPTSRARRRR